MPLVCHWESSSVLSNPSKSTNPVGLQRGRVPCPPQNAIGVAKIACLMSSSKTHANASKSHRRSKSENGSWFSRKPPLQPAPATAASVPKHLHCLPPPDDYYPRMLSYGRTPWLISLWTYSDVVGATVIYLEEAVISRSPGRAKKTPIHLTHPRHGTLPPSSPRFQCCGPPESSWACEKNAHLGNRVIWQPVPQH